MHNFDVLKQLGLTEHESNAYLALLEIGEATVQQVAKKASIQRPNCYAVLDSLVKQGLVSRTFPKGRRFYVAEDPSVLTRIHQQRSVMLSSVLPDMRSLFTHAPVHTKTRFYEGKEGIKQIYEEILESDGYDGIYSPDVLAPVWGEYSSEFGIRAAKKGLKIRELIATRKPPVDYEHYFKKPLQEIRYLSKDQIVTTDIVFFENKLVLVAYQPTLHAVVIEGSSIVETQLLLFEIAWKHAAKST